MKLENKLIQRISTEVTNKWAVTLFCHHSENIEYRAIQIVEYLAKQLDSNHFWVILHCWQWNFALPALWKDT